MQNCHTQLVQSHTSSASLDYRKEQRNPASAGFFRLPVKTFHVTPVRVTRIRVMMEPENTSYTGLDEVLQALKTYVSQHGGQSKAALALGVSRAFLWKIQTKKKNVSQDILEKLGFELVVSKHYQYSKKKEV